MKRAKLNWDEEDVVHARKWYCCFQRAGATDRVKRRIRRRERRLGKKELVDDGGR